MRKECLLAAVQLHHTRRKLCSHTAPSSPDTSRRIYNRPAWSLDQPTAVEREKCLFGACPTPVEWIHFPTSAHLNVLLSCARELTTPAGQAPRPSPLAAHPPVN